MPSSAPDSRSPAPGSPNRFELFASTAPDLESIAAGELKTHGVKGRQEVGGVAFGGDLDRIYQANLWLRTASRVVVRLGRFHASTFYELERRSKKIPWADFLPATGPVALRVTCRKSRLYHSDAVAERVLSAIARAAPRAIEMKTETAVADEDGDETADSSAPEQGQPQLFIVRIVDDECEISADSSGALLHKRGYRQETGKAPLRETLAAAMVLASGWKRGDPLLDPMCGSGTIPIEAALIARGAAPGLLRDFQFMKWPGFDGKLWKEMLEQAREGMTDDVRGEVRGTDRDAGAIAAAVRNAQRAGVSEAIKFSVDALSASVSKLDDVGAGPGWILTNPPYGVRVGESAELRNLYASLGTVLKSKQGWRLGMLTADPMLARQTGLPLRPRFSTSNGGIPVQFLATEKRGKADAPSLEPRFGRRPGESNGQRRQVR
ncbi:MAG: class I SAM-dependent RNA methyltransferase [Gemmatimonadales bacterium]